MRAAPSYVAEDLWPLCVPIDSVFPDPDNFRVHSERNLSAIAASLERFGQRKSIVVNSRNMTVEAGNGTLEAAKALGWEWIAVSHEDDDAVSAAGFGIADNRSAELATWNYAGLGEQLERLRSGGVDVGDLGFDEHEVKALLDGMTPSAEGLDPDAIDGYTEEEDTYLIKVDGVTAAEKDEVLGVIGSLLDGRPHLKATVK